MTPTKVSKEKNTVKFTMEFTAEEFDAATEKVFQKNRSKITIDGFRKGKAPRSIIEKKYGAGVFYEEAIDDLINGEYPKALDALEIEPIDYPKIEFGEEKIEKGKGFVVTVSVDEAPVVVPKDYKGMAVNRKIHIVTDADVQQRLEQMQKRNARQVEITDGAAENGDTVILDYKGFCGDEQFEGGTAENYELKLGSNSFIPGFEDQLVGVKAGEEKDVNVTFPAEYHSEKLAGKDATFKCKIHSIKREELPAIDDEFAKDASEFDTLEELKASTKKELEESAERTKEYTGKDAAVAKLVELNDFEVPNAMIESELKNLMAEYEQNMQYQGISLDMYCKYIGKTKEELSEEMKPTAAERVKSRLLILAVADAEKIEVSDDEVNAELKKMADQYKMSEEEVKNAMGGNTKYIVEDLKSTKAVQFLYDNAVFTDIDDSKEEPKEEAKEEAE